jgi:spore germination protein YaaH
MKIVSLSLLLLVAACSHHPDTQKPSTVTGVTPQDVVWTQVVNATADGSTLTKSGGQPSADDAGGVSSLSLGASDGWLELTVVDTQAFRFVGLGRPHSGTSDGAIDFAFRFQAGQADVYEDGVWLADNSVVAGDTLRVAVSSGIVTYSKNGNAIYTSAGTPQYPLAAYASLIDPGAAVTGARLGLDSPTSTAVGGTLVTDVTAVPAAAGNAATVSWTTSAPTDGQVQYGADSSYGTWSVYAATAGTSHSITLVDLTPGTTYHYSVRSEDAGAKAVFSADATFTTPTPPSGVATNRHRFCGWLQATGWVPVEQDPNYLDFVAHAAEFDAVHPTWYSLASTTTFAPSYGEGSSLVLANTTAGGKRTLLIPTIAAADGSQPAWASQMVNDAGLRAQHEAAIVNLVLTKGYDGIDLDYEHLQDSDKPGFSTFAQELGALLHAQGKTLSFAVGGLMSNNYSHWDYDALSAAADQLHVMGYDFHYLGSHSGPVTPLGWIQLVLAYIDTVGGGTRAGKFILGLPNYGLAASPGGNTSWYGSSMDSINLVGGNYATTTTHMASCSYTNGVSMASGRAPNGTSSAGQIVYFDDIASHEEKVAAAQAAGLGGITYWTIGGEPDRPGTRSWFDMVRSYFPQ